jgi:acyl-CoA reductase-like NAD-dependent aldehyde dehydrogenase
VRLAKTLTAMNEPLLDKLPLRDLPINVGGEWRRGRGHAYQSLYPADLSVSAELHVASAEDATEAVERAHDAFVKTNWAHRKPHERAVVLYRIAEAIRTRREELAHLQRRDNGKPITETRALVDSAAATFQFMAAACEEEIFGPVLVALPFDDEDDLLAQANHSLYALAAGIWSRDYKRIWRVARAVQAGTVWINTYKQFSISTPFGGWRDSGIGREKGRLGILEYMEQKSLYWGMNDTPLPWAQ